MAATGDSLHEPMSSEGYDGTSDPYAASPSVFSVKPNTLADDTTMGDAP
jgi:hypothetical protein